MNPTEPTLAGAGSFRGSVTHQADGSQAAIIGYPSVPVLINGARRVTVTVSNASMPSISISDDDSSTFTSVTGQPSNQAQWTATNVSSHAVGGNRIHIVFPNAVQKGLSPLVLVEDFHPSGQ